VQAPSFVSAVFVTVQVVAAEALPATTSAEVTTKQGKERASHVTTLPAPADLVQALSGGARRAA